MIKTLYKYFLDSKYMLFGLILGNVLSFIATNTLPTFQIKLFFVEYFCLFGLVIILRASINGTKYDAS